MQRHTIGIIAKIRGWIARLGMVPTKGGEMDIAMYKRASKEARDKCDLAKLIASKEKLSCRYVILRESGVFPDLTLARMKRSIEDLNRRIAGRTRAIVAAARGQVMKEAAALATAK